MKWTPSSSALVIYRINSTTVHMSSVLVFPTQRSEEVDLSLKTIVIERCGKDSFYCKDNIRANLVVRFFLRVSPIAEDILLIAQSIGCKRAGQQSALEELFSAKFSEAIRTVCKKLAFEELFTHSEEFRDEIIYVIGSDLNGFILEEVVVDEVHQLPLEQFDPSNILDAQGIEKITAITAHKRLRTQELERERERVTERHEHALRTVTQLEAKQSVLTEAITILEQKIEELESTITKKLPSEEIDDYLSLLKAEREAKLNRLKADLERKT